MAVEWDEHQAEPTYSHSSGDERGVYSADVAWDEDGGGYKWEANVLKWTNVSERQPGDIGVHGLNGIRYARFGPAGHGHADTSEGARAAAEAWLDATKEQDN